MMWYGPLAVFLSKDGPDAGTPPGRTTIYNPKPAQDLLASSSTSTQSVPGPAA